MTTTKPQHTPGPWHIGNVEGGPSRISKRVHYLAIYDADDNFVCEIYTRRIEEPFTDAEQYRAARIVACVNACQLFDDPDAGILGLREDRAAFKDERDALRADNARLREALHRAESWLTNTCSHSDENKLSDRREEFPIEWRIIDQARAALAKETP